MRTFRAATLNIWNRFGPWEERAVAIHAQLKELAPDVIGMQEVLRYESFDQAKIVSEGLGYHVAWGEASENHGYPVGNAILSKWEIAKQETIPLPDGGSDENRSIIFAELNSPFGKIPVFCTHLNWKLHHGHIRQMQVRALADAVAARAPIEGFPPVVLGDFNAEPDSDEIRFMKGLTGLGGKCVYFADAFGIAGDGTPGYTFSKRNDYAGPLREPERRIDYVFVRGPDDSQRGETLEARVCFDTPHKGVFPTDHFGVTCIITAGR